MTTRTIDLDALRSKLYEAQEHLNEAISLITDYVCATGDRYAEAYLLDHLKIFAGRNYGFFAGDLNLDDLIEQLDEYEVDEE